MCSQGLHSQCETTQVHEQGSGAALFGYTKLYGQVPGGQAEFLRVPFGNTLPIKVPDGPPDDRFVYLSDVLPTAWQAVAYAAVPDGGSPDAVIDAVGMEAHGSPAAQLTQQATALLPDAMQGWLMKRVGVDRLHALYLAIEIVRRGGTVSLSGVYGGMADPMPMLR